MTLLQCMILFMCVGQVVAPVFRYGGSDDLKIFSLEKRPKNYGSQEPKYLYSDAVGDIFLVDNNFDYKVLNFKLERGLTSERNNFVPQKVQNDDLLPIYYENRLGLILELSPNGEKYALAFQNDKDFIYLTLSQKDLNDLVSYSKNPAQGKGIGLVDEKGTAKLFFKAEQFFTRDYYLSLSPDDPRPKFSKAPPKTTPSN